MRDMTVKEAYRKVHQIVPGLRFQRHALDDGHYFIFTESSRVIAPTTIAVNKETGNICDYMVEAHPEFYGAKKVKI